MEAITYNLSTDDNAGRNFYADLAAYTDKMLVDIKNFAGQDITPVSDFASVLPEVKSRSINEYYIEFVSIGVYWNVYIENAVKSSRISTAALTSLYHIRKKKEFLKPGIDRLRGILTPSLLIHSKKRSKPGFTLKDFSRLINWLESTGEFNEEVHNLLIWKLYFTTLPTERVSVLIERASDFAFYFDVFGRKYLGTFTQNVNNFLVNQEKNYKFSEDRIFTGRNETEYFFNVFAAEVINRTLKQAFDKTTAKVVLLPTCMSRPENMTCRAKTQANRMICTNCSKTCNINRIKTDLGKDNISVYLIPHSSDFSKYLKYWRDQNTTGLVGVACILNLLTGGLQMQNLNIPSQCVFLDYSSCPKHWHTKGFPTNINTNQLNKILDRHIENNVPLQSRQCHCEA